MPLFKFDKTSMKWGFCIESRTDDEMPEVLLGAIHMHNLHLEYAVTWENTNLTLALEKRKKRLRKNNGASPAKK